MAKIKKKAAPKTAPAKRTVSTQLREVIESRELTAYLVGKMSEVDAAVIGRFLSGEREIRSGTLDKIALALGLRLVEVEKKGKR